MKKWIFVIFPGLLLAIFLFFYQQTTADIQAREHRRAEDVQRQKEAEASKKKMIEDNARRDAEKRAVDQKAEDDRKDAEAAAQKKAERDRVQAATDEANAELDRYSKDSADLELQLDRLRKEKDQETRADADLERAVQDSQIRERNAELEIQRMVDMIAQRASQSYLTRMPPPPPPTSD
jgi:hypothetical protein